MWKKINEIPVHQGRFTGRYRAWVQEIKAEIESLDISKVDDDKQKAANEVARLLHSSLRHAEVRLGYKIL